MIKALKENWLIVSALATLCFFSGGAWMRLSAVETELTKINAQLGVFTASYITRAEVRAFKDALDDKHRDLESRLYRLEGKMLEKDRQ